MKTTLRIMLAVGFLALIASAVVLVNLAADRFAAQDRPALSVAYTAKDGQETSFRPECTASHWLAKDESGAALRWVDTQAEGAQFLRLVTERILGSGIDLIFKVESATKPDTILVQRYPDSRYHMEDGVLRESSADDINVLWSREGRTSTGRVTYHPGCRYVVTVYFGEAFAQYQFYTRRAFEDTTEPNLFGFAYPMNESEPNQILFDPGEWIEASDRERIRATGIGELSEYLSGLLFYNQDEQTIALELIDETIYFVTVVDNGSEAGERTDAAGASEFFALVEATGKTVGAPPLYCVEEADGKILSIEAQFLP